MVPSIPALDTHPNNQLRNEKWGGHYALFVAMLHSLHSVTNKEHFFAGHFRKHLIVWPILYDEKYSSYKALF